MKALCEYRALVRGLAIASLVVLASCSTTQKYEKAAQIKADAAGLSVAKHSSVTQSFKDKNVDFSQYKKIIFTPLDLTQVEIIKPDNNSSTHNTPWELNDGDKSYYQEQYQKYFSRELIDDGAFALSEAPAADTLQISAKLLQIVPKASKDDFKGRPTIMKVYSEGVGTMTIEISLVDSTTGKLVGLFVNQRNLGDVWTENNRATFNVQVHLAFQAWLRKLSDELDSYAQK